jgi:multiple sugar transport system ATP-binding protein
MNFLRASNTGTSRVNIGAQSLPAPSSLPDGDLLVGIRAENIRAFTSPQTGALQAETVVVEPLGSHNLVTASMDGQLLKIVTRTDFASQPGTPIWLEPEPDKLRWLRAADGQNLDAVSN